MGQLKLITGIFMIVLFTIAIIGYATHFGIDNGSAVKIDDLDNELTNLNEQLVSNLSQSRLDVDSASAGFFNSSLPQSATSIDTTSVTGGQFKTIIISPFKAIKSIFSSVNKNIFGQNSEFGIFLVGILSLLIITGIFYIWKTWKGGNPN